MSFGEKKKKTQYKQPDWRHTKACITSLFQRYLTSCAVGITSSTKNKNKKRGSWEPRGHPSMRAADLQTELSDYENTTAFRNALKSTALFQRFPMQLQLGYCHPVPKHKSFLSSQSRQNPVDPNIQYCHCIRWFLQMTLLIAAPLGGGLIFKVAGLSLNAHVYTHTETTSVPPFIQGLQFLSFITSKDLTSDL